MAPAFGPGDLVLIDKRGFGHIGLFGIDLLRYPPFDTALPADGTIVIFRHADGYEWLRRVIGRPGDRVELANDVLSVDGTDVSSTEDRQCGDEWCRVDEHVGDASYTAIYRILKLSSASEGTWAAGSGWFVMGDNRDNSLDSRYFGSITTEQLRGRVVLVLDQQTVESFAMVLTKLVAALP